MANPLDIRTCITQISQALVETIDLAYRYRYPEAKDLVELQSLQTIALPHRSLRFVVDQGVCYRLILPSTLAHNPPLVIQPNDRPKNGRWIQTHSKVTLGPAYFRPLHRVRSGYARSIERYQDDTGHQLERIYGQRPSFLVEWVQDDLQVSSTVQGGWYKNHMQFVLHALCKNYRPEEEALEGSPVDQDMEPGLDRMIGDLRYLLAGSDLGLGPGIQYCDIQGNAKITVQDLSQRSFTAEIPLKIIASVHRADEDLLPLQEVWIQEQLAELRGLAVFDEDNYLRKGYRIIYTGGLLGTPNPGIAYVGGLLVASAPGVRHFTPQKDTYRDLGIDGVLRYTEVDVAAPAPIKEPGTLRIGFTRTDANEIVDDFLLCASLEDYADPYRIPKYSDT